MNKKTVKISCIIIFALGYAILSLIIPPLNIFIAIAGFIFSVVSSSGYDVTYFEGHPSAAIIIMVLVVSFIVNAIFGGFLGFWVYKLSMKKIISTTYNDNNE